MNYPIMTRTFHAVGHGCFVTEIFKSQKCNDVKVVYDCGGKKKLVEKEINNIFNADDIIDLLFISHFDNDHINGLRTLLNRCQQIDKLYIPFLSEKGKIVMAFSCLANEETITNEYLDDYLNITFRLIFEPENLFKGKNTEIKKVLPINYDSGISDDRTKVVSSNTELEINKIIKDWVYVPFVHGDEQYYKIIINKIKSDSVLKQYIDVNDNLKKREFLNDIKNRIKLSNNKVSGGSDIELCQYLKNFFEQNGGSNENSLILYSGNVSLFNFYIRNFSSCCNLCCLRCFNDYYIKAGCLYFGDYNASKYFNDSKDEDFFKKYLNKCDTILLPHHGSLESFSNNLFEYGFKLAVACHDIRDRYGHPSPRVCKNLLLNNRRIISVTEETFTSASFKIYYER